MEDVDVALPDEQVVADRPLEEVGCGDEVGGRLPSAFTKPPVDLSVEKARSDRWLVATN